MFKFEYNSKFIEEYVIDMFICIKPKKYLTNNGVNLTQHTKQIHNFL